jgi:bile acid:Na+ symporter, BASS family
MASWYPSVERVLIPTQLVFIMLAMGATLRLRDFAALARAPGSVALALALQWIVVPAGAAGLAHALELSAGWTIGLLLIAAAPPAAFSNLFTLLGRGNVALSVSITAVTAAATVGTIPIILGLLARTHMPAGFELPARKIAVDITLFLIAPLAAGMVVRRVWERRAELIARWCVRGALLLVVALTAGALGSQRIRVTEYGWGPPLIIILFGTVMAILTPQVGRLLGRFDDDTLAMTVQVAMRNMGVSLLMVRYFFPGRPEQGQVLYSCLFYAGAAMWFSLPAVIAHRYGWSPVFGRQPHRRAGDPSPLEGAKLGP